MKEIMEDVKPPVNWNTKDMLGVRIASARLRKVIVHVKHTRRVVVLAMLAGSVVECRSGSSSCEAE